MKEGGWINGKVGVEKNNKNAKKRVRIVQYTRGPIRNGKTFEDLTVGGK